MKKWIAVVTMVVVGLMPAIALAHHGTGSHEGDDGGGGQSQQQGQQQGQGQKQKQGQAQGQGQSQNATGGTGIGIGVGIGTGGQGGSATQSQGSTTSKNTQSTSTSVDASQGDYPRQAPPAFAPNLVAAPETCMGSTAIGASTPFGGVAIGTTYKSEDCELRMFARSLSALGQNEAALALLAQNPKVAAALRAVGAKLAWLQQEKDQTPVVVVAVGATSTLSRTSEGP